MKKKLYAILIKDKNLKDSPYLFMSAGSEMNQGRCFIYQSKEYAKTARKNIQAKLDYGCKAIIFVISPSFEK